MTFPAQRPRRLRSSENIRRMVRETVLSVDDLIYPVFVTHGKGVARPVESMPGIYNYSIDMLLKHLDVAARLKIPGILPFGIPAAKDEVGSEAYAEDGIIQQAVRAIKEAFPELLVITDICLCEYTSHGHCGLIRDGRVANDPTLDLLARTAVSHAAAGADMVAPSDMMDGRVGAIRRALDKEGFKDVPVMAYSAKYASAYYGPFRDAAGSAPQFGDRRAYQMDPANSDEAVQDIFRVLKPHKADTVDDLPVLKCEMDMLYVSAGARQLKLNRKVNSLKQQLDENNEPPEIQKTLLEAEKSGGLNKKSQTKIQALLKKPSYQELPDKEKKEIIEGIISGIITDPVDKILNFANLKHDPSPKDIEKCIAIIVQLSENLSRKLDAINPGLLSNKQTEKLTQTLKQLEIKIRRFTHHNMDGITK
jgi:porphobilinogen synthase